MLLCRCGAMIWVCMRLLPETSTIPHIGLHKEKTNSDPEPAKETMEVLGQRAKCSRSTNPSHTSTGLDRPCFQIPGLEGQSAPKQINM